MDLTPTWESSDDEQAKQDQFLAAQDEDFAAKTKNLRTTRKQLESDQGYLQSIGEEPMPAPAKSPIGAMLDVISAPGQWMRGITAKLVGMKDYEDKSFLEAAGQGASQSLTGADLLRGTDTVHNPFLRGAAGFGIDVLTDPLQYVTLGFSQEARIAGEAVTGVKQDIGYGAETAHDMFARMSSAYEADELERLTPALNAAQNPQLAESLLQKAKTVAQSKAEQDFSFAKSYLEDSKQYKALGVDDLFDRAKELATNRKAELDAKGEIGPVYDEAINPQLTEQMLAQKFERVKQGFLKIKGGQTLGPEESLAFQKGVEDFTPETLKNIFKPESIRFTSPLAGIGVPYLSNIPLLGKRESDIPVVTDAVIKMKSAMQNAYYGASIKVPAWVEREFATRDDVMAKLGMRVLSGMRWANGKAVDIASLVSRRVQNTGQILGGANKLRVLQQNERDRGYLMWAEVQNAIASGADVLKYDDHEEIFKHITRAMDGAIADHIAPVDLSKQNSGEMAAALPEGQELPPNTVSPMAVASKEAERAEVLQNTMARLDQALVDPEKARAAKSYAQYIWDEYDRIGRQDVENGVINNVDHTYISHLYDFTNAKGDPELARAAMLAKLNPTGQAGQTDFGMMRYHDTLQEAKANLLNPNENAMQMLIARRYASERALSEKDFAERLQWQWAVPKPVYDQLTTIARDKISSEKFEAVETLRSLGVLDRTVVEGAPLIGTNGKPLDPQVFDNMRAIFDHYGPETDVYKTAMGNLRPEWFQGPGGTAIAPREFFSDPARRAQVEQFFNGTSGLNKIMLGVLGERAFARAGSTTMSDFLKSKMLKTVSAEDKVFWEGLIPQTLHDAVDESYNTADLLRRFVDKRADGKPKNQALRIVDGMLGYLGSANRVMKKAITQWPAYHTRNMYSVGPQAAMITSPYEQLVASTQSTMALANEAGKALLNLPGKLAGRPGWELGRHLNIDSILWSKNLMDTGANLVTEGGKVYRNAELSQIMHKAGIQWNTVYADDALVSMGDMMDQMTRSPALMGAVPDLKRWKQEENGATFYNNAMRWAGLKKDLALTDRHWEALPTFGERMEAFGRQHTFLNLLKRDYSPESAAALTNQLHIDYTNAKTAFERDVMNKTFFFYSFSRGNATNLALSMFRKPGALTTQLHAINAVGEMLRPENFVSDPDAEDAVKSSRLKDQIAVYLGRNQRTNLPEFLSQTGLPVEDLTKYAAISAPGSMRVSELLRAGQDTAHRTAALVASQTNPLIKSSIEMLTGRSLFFDRPLTDDTLRKVPTWNRDIGTIVHYPFKAIPKEVWDGMDTVTKEVLLAKDNGDGTITANPYALAALTSIIPATMGAMKMGGPLAETLAHSSRFLATRSALTDPGVGEAAKYLRLFTGAHIVDADPSISQAYDQSAHMQQYMDELGIPKSKRLRKRMAAAEQADNNEE